jgi:hypothetical protein
VRFVSSKSLSVALILLVGCTQAAPPTGSGGPGAGSHASGASGAPGGSGAGLTIGPDLSFSEEAAASAEATATFDDGGSLTATASDGTTFELEVPPHAVLDDTEVRMTPLADVQGVGDRPAHAVRLEPEGQLFYEPVRLTITPSSPIPLEQQVMFQAKSDGKDVTAALIDVDSEAIVLLLQHFSVAGAGYAQSQAAWLINHAQQRLDLLGHEVAKVLQKERRGQLVEGEEDPDVMDKVKDLFDLAERDVLSYLRQAATLTCEATQAYIHGLLALEKQRELIGLSTDATEANTRDETVRAIDASFPLCEKEKIQECRDDMDPAILVSFWIIWDRQRSLRGEETPWAAVGDFVAKARRLCAIDLKIDKTVSMTQMNVSFTIRYQAIKCGGPEGVWEIDSAGTLTGYGGTATIGGPVTVEIDERTLTGPVEGEAIFDAPLTGHSEGHFVGTAEVIQDPNTRETTRLDLKITGGTGNGYTYGFLDTGMLHPGTLTFPVEQGSFCEL